jgi:hypothetical protein
MAEEQAALAAELATPSGPATCRAIDARESILCSYLCRTALPAKRRSSAPASVHA